MEHHHEWEKFEETGCTDDKAYEFCRCGYFKNEDGIVEMARHWFTFMHLVLKAV